MFVFSLSLSYKAGLLILISHSGIDKNWRNSWSRSQMTSSWKSDTGIVTLHNSTVNLPVKGQATGKIVDTIETSWEKINLWTCKGKIIGFNGQCELESLINAYFLTNFFQKFSSVSGSISSVSWSLTWGTLAKWMIFVAELTFLLPSVVYFAHHHSLFRNANFFLF